ncbi:RAN guanine nucleotide release factor [Ceraceosorus bombacis]|uniref:RAN guanine nucleotide release factor n=1 Tax=Ceraceosorus bombacis TaxID=401625 RepID=A0A0P1BLM8_9BASI|nr:RAN guanine nucleotide release factor [Ceraceosorus bombacis]
MARLPPASTSTEHYTARDLFGGAIKVDVPFSFLDVSDVRQVPDTQEVHVSRDKDDISLIVEILQAVDVVAQQPGRSELESAVRYHFDSIAHDGGAASSSVKHVWTTSPSPATSVSQPSTPCAVLLMGEQSVVKYGERFAHSAQDRIRVWVALFRLRPARNIDLVLSVNEPLAQAVADNDTGQEDLRAESAGERVEQVKDEAAESRARGIFERAAGTLRIHDWDLFAE